MDPLNVFVGLFPVVLFLVGLMLLDSYKLVTWKSVLLTIGVGALAALACLIVNRLLLRQFGVDETLLRHYIAPVLEEGAKAAYVVYLIRSERVGFMVDAGVHGFAVGTGFALVENVYYAGTFGDAGLALWIMRGVGTAAMHGSATAIVGILSKSLTDRRRSGAFYLFLPGLAFAAGIHGLFNHFVLNPLVGTGALLIVMPLLVMLVFERSEKATREWLDAGLESDVELLELIDTGEISKSPVGEYLASLKSRFPGLVVADMLCLLEIHVELSLRAKGMLIARAAGVDLPVDDDVRESFEEMKYLERSIGKTGKMAILPFMRTRSRDLWELYTLGK